ncbi:restriction endonuclease [Candidatus Bathyarchaeota archaeon]|nr:restriction endonuclease [Candidatus Bathyarchaeota archaeon]
MKVERNLLIEILKLTRNGPVLQDKVYKNVNVSRNFAVSMLKKLEQEGVIYLRDGTLHADRLKLAVLAIRLGSDIERVCCTLDWKEFEKVAVLAFESNGYDIIKNLRFKEAEHRWEIDVVGFRKPFIVCVDCKHWLRGVYPSALKQIVEKQVRRVEALAHAIASLSEKLPLKGWCFAKLVPVILSLVPSRFKIYEGVPVVPVFQLQDFLLQLPSNADALRCFYRSLTDELHSGP